MKFTKEGVLLFLSLSLIAVTVFVVRSMEMKKAVHSARETGSPVKLRSAWHPEKKGKKREVAAGFTVITAVT